LQFIGHASREVLAFGIRDLATFNDRQNLIGGDSIANFFPQLRHDARQPDCYMLNAVRGRADRTGDDDPAGYRAAPDRRNFNTGGLDILCAELLETLLRIRRTGTLVGRGFFLCRGPEDKVPAAGHSCGKCAMARERAMPSTKPIARRDRRPIMACTSPYVMQAIRRPAKVDPDLWRRGRLASFSHGATAVRTQRAARTA
jgi:hypothetical protein